MITIEDLYRFRASMVNWQARVHRLQTLHARLLSDKQATYGNLDREDAIERVYEKLMNARMEYENTYATVRVIEKLYRDMGEEDV